MWGLGVSKESLGLELEPGIVERAARARGVRGSRRGGRQNFKGRGCVVPLLADGIGLRVFLPCAGWAAVEGEDFHDAGADHGSRWVAVLGGEMAVKRLAAGSMGYGRTFYADESEDLAYLKQLARDWHKGR